MGAGKKQEPQKGTQPGSRASSAPAPSRAQRLSRESHGLQSHLLTQRCRTRDFFSPLTCKFIPNLSKQKPAPKITKKQPGTGLVAFFFFFFPLFNQLELQSVGSMPRMDWHNTRTWFYSVWYLPKKCPNTSPSLGEDLWCKTKEIFLSILGNWEADWSLLK